MESRQNAGVKKEEIVRAAVEVIGRNGVQALTISAIAETAGMSKTNFYRHFSGKDEIFFAIAEYIGTAITEKAAAVATGTKKSLEKLEAIFFSHMRMVAENPGISRFVYSEEVHLTIKNLAETVSFIFGSYVKVVSSIVAAGVEKGELRRDLSSRETALTFIGMIQFAALRWTISEASFDKRDEAQRLWNNFLLLAL